MELCRLQEPGQKSGKYQSLLLFWKDAQGLSSCGLRLAGMHLFKFSTVSNFGGSKAKYDGTAFSMRNIPVLEFQDTTMYKA